MSDQAIAQEDPVLKIIRSYKDLEERLNGFRPKRLLAGLKARRLKKKVGKLEKKAEQYIRQNGEQVPFKSVRKSALETAESSGIYGRLPSLKERLKGSANLAYELAEFVIKSAIPFSFLYYAPKKVNEEGITGNKKRKIYVVAAFGELAKTTLYTALIMYCITGSIPVPGEDLAKKTGQEQVIEKVDPPPRYIITDSDEKLI
ncbi:hypothetical protein KY349_00520 [Candidatus Woesearchaeota archaeon]|jgi:hypothetical protein|nr:hypothetical protein [Candidatus Woesearchaeota archaeon]